MDSSAHCSNCLLKTVNLGIEYLADPFLGMYRLRSVQGRRPERLTATKVDRLSEEDAFRLIDDIRSDANFDLPRPKDDLSSIGAYSHYEPTSDHRMDNLERMMAALAKKVDQVIDRRESTPVDSLWRPCQGQDMDNYVRAHLERECINILTQGGKALAGEIFVQKPRLEGKTL